MRALLDHINWKAVSLAFLAAYSLPILLACTPISEAIWRALLWIFSPICAGYLAARFAQVVPLNHGLVVSLMSLAVLMLLNASPHGGAFLVWIAINIACSVFGARLWRNRNQVRP